MKNNVYKKIAAASAAALCALYPAAPIVYAHAAPEEDEVWETGSGDYYGFDENKPYDSTIDLVVDRLYFGLEDPDTSEEQPDEDADEELPPKFDLRDVDGVCYVPEIRSQDPFGTCWSFGAIAASEISIAYALGLDYNTMTDEEKSMVDLSEKHLAWFSYTALSGDPLIYGSQMGEGYHFACLDDGIDSNDETYLPYNEGGFAHYASVLFSEGIGPAGELDVPYTNKDGTWEICVNPVTFYEDYSVEYGETEYGAVAPDRASIDAYIADYLERNPGRKNYDTEFDGPGEYYAYTVSRGETGDWSLDESQRFQGFFLKESNILPSPARYGENGYEYDAAATRAIKRELLAGRGVAVNFRSDQARPGEVLDPEETYLNFLTADGMPAEFMEEAAIWAHYTYERDYDPDDPYSWNGVISSNHAVCIVGYDDTFPKEYFNDPKGTIGGDGAWIVRNSWGSVNNSDPTAEYSWGNNGDGYFYISYYDQSLNDPESYEFYLFDPDDMGRSLDIYDLFPSFDYNVATFDKPVYMANVFTADTKEVIRDIGVMTAQDGLEAHFTVYLLKDGFTSPTDGVKAAETVDFFDCKGYHTTRLEDKVIVEEGQKYSVVLELRRADGQYVYEINSASNKTAYEAHSEEEKQNYISEYGSLDGYVDSDPLYAKLIVNRGESFLGTEGESGEEWKDLVDIRAVYDEYNTDFYEMACLDYDNFPIRSYPYADQIQVTHTIDDPKPVYDAGDVIRGTVTIKNVTAKYTYTDVSVVSTLAPEGVIGHFDEFAPGDTRTLKYSYTVTEDDLGEDLSGIVAIDIGGELYVFLEEFEPESYELKTAAKKPAVTTAITEPEPPVTTDPPQTELRTEPEPSQTSDPFNLAFIIIFLVIVIGAPTIAVIASLLRRKK